MMTNRPSQSLPFLIMTFATIITFSSCKKDEQDLTNYHPELSMFERVKMNDLYLLEGNWKTIHIYDWDLNDHRTTTERSESLIVTKSHWIIDGKAVPYHMEFVNECGWLVRIFLHYPEGEQKLTLQYTDENGYYYGSHYYMGSEPYEFATIQLEPEGSDPWRIDKVFVAD